MEEITRGVKPVKRKQKLKMILTARAYDVLGIISFSLCADSLLMSVEHKWSARSLFACLLGAVVFYFSGWKFFSLERTLKTYEKAYDKLPEEEKLGKRLLVDEYVLDIIKLRDEKILIIKDVILGIIFFLIGMLSIFFAVYFCS